ncbi:RHS repeat-associated core domain-containing protein [Parasphingopyxis lamellibrachiae]|uniref:RHS repeat-associated core domain-containing protein n=1 Tax=Parasphingopyxis lamellibrachiae TaxID=680125 RepID=UPI000E2892C9|nr:RHS repeat-associated core domain-containing protein [Parasphingopyxis lamellibrachiae]
MTSATVGGGSLYNLRYDGLGRLYRTWGNGEASTYYTYDGDALVAEYSHSGTLLRRYIHGPGVDDPILWYEGASTAASNRRFLHADERGSIIGITNNSAVITQRNSLDDWGIPAPGNDGRFGYTGQVWLDAIGMNYYKARMYSPSLGRFMQTDPIGYDDGMNMYAYVGNDPMNGTDPTGEIVVISGDEEFARRANAAIAVVRETQEGSDVFDQLHSSDEIHVIVESPNDESGTRVANLSQTDDGRIVEGPSNDNATNGQGTGSIILLGTPQQDSNLDGSDAVSVGHEFGHSQDIDSGRLIEDGGLPRETGTTPRSEMNSLRIENAVRRSQGLRNRSAYYYPGWRSDARRRQRRR